jgi:hypothetical protein
MRFVARQCGLVGAYCYAGGEGHAASSVPEPSQKMVGYHGDD